MPKLLCFGTGYTARALIARLKTRDGWRFAGTSRNPLKREIMAAQGIEMRDFDEADLTGVTHILHSVPPGADGDPVRAAYGDILAVSCPDLEWMGYLSTTGVYGDKGGAWVDETTPPGRTGARGRRRQSAEKAWLGLSETAGLPVHIFRLAGIYGPGRNVLLSVRAGNARRIVKPGQVFSRIHVEDIVTVLEASMARPRPGAVYNVCDDEPAAHADVVEFACALLEVAPPPVELFEDASVTLSPMALGFYAESKRCRNTRIKEELRIQLQYPTYREGLRMLMRTLGS